MTTIGKQIKKVSPIVPRTEMANKINSFMKTYGLRLAGGSFLEYEDGTKAVAIFTDRERGYGETFPKKLKNFLGMPLQLNAKVI